MGKDITKEKLPYLHLFNITLSASVETRRLRKVKRKKQMTLMLTIFQLSVLASQVYRSSGFSLLQLQPEKYSYEPFLRHRMHEQCLLTRGRVLIHLKYIFIICTNN